MRPDPLLQFRFGLIAIGVVVVLALIAAFAPQLLDRRQSALAIFDNVENLAEGAEVRDAGFVIGRVTGIEQQLENRRFLVRFRYDPEWMPPAGREAGLIIEAPNPLQPGVLTVTTCKESPLYDQALPGDQMRGCGRTPTMIEQGIQAIQVASGLVTSVNDMLTKFLPATGAGTVSSEPSLVDRATTTLENVEAVTGDLRTLLAVVSQNQVAGIMRNLDATSKNALAASATVNELIGAGTESRRNLDQIIANLRTTSEGANETLTSVKSLLGTSAKPTQDAITDLRYILGVTAASMSGIAINLEATSSNLRDITSQLRDDPSTLIKARERVDPPFVNLAPN